MLISGMSGNEIYCLAQKGFEPGEIAVGNSVCSMGLGGAIGSFGQSLAGGEISAVTELISGGRHAAIQRMQEEAHRHGAVGVTSVVSELRTLAGYTEFIAQGTSVHAQGGGPHLFSSAASGMELYCHLDVGYHPMRFVMGNIAYALGIGRGITGKLRTFGAGRGPRVLPDVQRDPTPRARAAARRGRRGGGELRGRRHHPDAPARRRHRRIPAHRHRLPPSPHRAGPGGARAGRDLRADRRGDLEPRVARLRPRAARDGHLGLLAGDSPPASAPGSGASARASCPRSPQSSTAPARTLSSCSAARRRASAPSA